MHGKFGNSQIQPYALGLTPQSSTYGTTIPVIYGRTRTAVFLTWCNNLRNGASSKATKIKKGAPQTWVENVAFLLGHNPIPAVLQFWQNNNQQLYLNFPAPETLTITPGSASSYTMMDGDFLFLLGVTLTVPISWTDLACTAASKTVTSATGGFLPSIVGAYIDITSGTNFVAGAYQVTGYNNQGSIVVKSSPAPSGNGTGGNGGLAFNDYGGQGLETFSGTTEIPMWNSAQAGPNRINVSAWRNYPYVYRCLPFDDTIDLDLNALGALPSGTLNFYYASLATGGGAPSAQLRLTFEPEFGDNAAGEFTGNDQNGNPLSLQQILYPMYAGLASQDLDLGTTQAIPNIVPETVGAFAFFKTADAEFGDMIEDIFMGTAQASLVAGPAYAAIQHGLNCYEFPGAIQKKMRTTTGAIPPLPMDLQATAGSTIIVATRSDSGSTLSAHDSQSNTYTNQLSAAGFLVATAPVSVNGQNTISQSPTSTNTDLQVIEFNGLDTIDSVVTATGTGGTITGSITTSNNQGEPAYIAAIVMGSSGGTNIQPTSLPPRWNPLMVGVGRTWSAYRIVKTPNTYTFSVPAGITGVWHLVLIAFKNSSPIQWPFALGNVIDDVSMLQSRLQCRAFGLMGSLFASSQKEGSAYLEEIAQASDSAPVWSGFKLKWKPLSEVSAVGNGAVYVAASASGPVANLNVDLGDAVGDSSNPPMTIPRRGQVDSPNVIQIQHPSRDAQYNEVATTGPDQSGISLFGVRKPQPITMDCIQDAGIARMIAGIMARQKAYLRNNPTLKLNAKWILLEPVDLITITDAQLGVFLFPVRLTSISEDENYQLDVEVEPFMYGVYSPTIVEIGEQNGYQPDTTHVPSNVNTPVMFEPVGALAGFPTVNEVWIIASNSDINYGGAQVYLSVDGGASFDFYGTITGNGQTGFTYSSDWPAHTDPDEVNNLLVDLSESNGAIVSNTEPIKDGHVIPGYVSCPTSWADLATIGAGATTLSSAAGGFSLDLAGQSIGITAGTNFVAGTYAVLSVTDANHIVVSGTPTPSAAGSVGAGTVVNGITPFVPYELMDYGTATLLSASHYRLESGSSGGAVIWLRRGSFGAPLPAQGVDHPIGSRFAVIEPDGSGRLVVSLNPGWIGKPLQFKLCAFNQYGGGTQDLSAVAAYTFTPVGLTLSITTHANSVAYTTSPSILLSQGGTPGINVTINIAAVSVTFPTNLASYTPRTALEAGVGVGPYYVTVYDPNYQGDYPVAWSDLACSGAGVQVVTSASGRFTQAMVGSSLYISSGTNFLAGQYLIIGYTNTNTITLKPSPSSGAASGGTGALQLPTYVDSTPSKVGIAGFTYLGTLTATTNPANAIITPGGWPPPAQFLVNNA